jgi:hypothetical protein
MNRSLKKNLSGMSISSCHSITPFGASDSSPFQTGYNSTFGERATTPAQQGEERPNAAAIVFARFDSHALEVVTNRLPARPQR